MGKQRCALAMFGCCQGGGERYSTLRRREREPTKRESEQGGVCMTQQPEEQFYPNSRAELLRRAPILHLFRAFRLAIDPRKMLLGAVAAVILAAGEWAIDQTPLAPPVENDMAGPAVNDVAWPWQRRIIDGVKPRHALEAMLSDPFRALAGSVWEGMDLLDPLRTIVAPGMRLFSRGNSWPDIAYAWTQLLFGLAVWSLLGGAIARIAALQFARDRGPTLREAVAYSARRFGATMSAPLLPLVFIGLFWLACWVVGLIGRIPAVGEAAAGILWFIPLLCGLSLAVILLFIAAGWPLMVCTISAEGTDGFDGLSRSYDYLLSRPWYALGLTLIMLVYGSLAIVFVAGVARIGTHLAEWGVSSGMNPAAVDGLTSGRPALLDDGGAAGGGAETSFLGRTAATFWLQFLGLMLWGFVYSFFWSAATIIYFLLRHSADAMPLDRVYVPASGGAPELPLVGIPAAERQENQRGEKSRSAETGGPTSFPPEAAATSQSGEP